MYPMVPLCINGWGRLRESGDLQKCWMRGGRHKYSTKKAVQNVFICKRIAKKYSCRKVARNSGRGFPPPLFFGQWDIFIIWDQTHSKKSQKMTRRWATLTVSLTVKRSFFMTAFFREIPEVIFVCLSLWAVFNTLACRPALLDWFLPSFSDQIDTFQELRKKRPLLQKFRTFGRKYKIMDKISLSKY